MVARRDPFHPSALRQLNGVGRARYVQLFDSLLAAIESGYWKSGDRMPSELWIARTTGLSPGTVQRALSLLVEQGLVTRHHGQGSFVAHKPVNTQRIRNFVFVDADSECPLPVYARVLSIERTASEGPWSRFLAPKSDFVLVRRLINVNLEFQTYSEVYLPAVRFAELLGTPVAALEGSLTTMLAERFNLPTLKVSHSVGLETLREGVADLIHCKAGAPALKWEIFSFTYRDQPSFYQRVLVPQSDRRLLIAGAV